jgi:hypothetical protein
MKYYSVGTYLVKKQKKINSVKCIATKKKMGQPIFFGPHTFFLLFFVVFGWMDGEK